MIMKQKRGIEILNGKEKIEGLYEITLHPKGRTGATSLLKYTNQRRVWHERLGHVGQTTIDKTLSLIIAIGVTGAGDVNCESCGNEKSKTEPRQKSYEISKRAINLRDLAHSDVVGPTPVPIKGGREYFATLYDDPRWLSLLRFSKLKFEVPKGFKHMITEMETAYEGRLKRTRLQKAME